MDYTDHLRLLDEQVGEILAKVKMRNDFDKTAITLMADHGEMLGDGGMLYKSTFIESAIRVPMIYRPPKGMKIGIADQANINLTGFFYENFKWLRNRR